MKSKVRHLSWRDGRPRWEPSPTLRKLGLKGRDLKDSDGIWLDWQKARRQAEALNEDADAKRLGDRPRGKAADPPGPMSNEKGYVYFIWCGSAVKIGISKDPLRRAQHLRTSIAEPITRFAFVPGTERDERRLHKRFSAHRKSGEWFAASAVDETLFLMIQLGTATLP